MRASALKYALVSALASIVMVILVVLPFHAFLTVWGASIVGHYTALRLWKEVLLLLCVIGVLYLVLMDHKIRSHTLTRRLVWVIFVYIAVNIIWGLVAYHQHGVSLKAMAYGVLLNTRFLIFFLVVWAIALRTERLRNRWQPLILYPAAIVVVFGLLQVFVLPHNFLGHFGYNEATIYPYETINHNQNYIRIMSTLRGANPLGAYLLIPISVLSVLIIRGKRSWQYVAFLVASLVVLFLTFSRGAWIGAVIMIGVILLLSLRSARSKQWALGIAGACVVLLLGLAAVAHNNARFENVFLHTQQHSASPTSSNQGHLTALKSGLHDISHQPLGKGTGSAGPASVYNNHPARIAENYYIQIGQELGFIGLGLFLLINVGVGYLLWLRREDTLALCLLASFIGISFVNLLSHAWTDDTLAYLWWGLAAIAMVNVAQPPKAAKAKTKAKS